ncbi:MAG: alpha/beta hydrolase family protein [Gemmatimonadota bacterium]
MPADQAEAARQELCRLLGDLPDRQRPLATRTVATEEREGYVLEKLVLELNGLEGVPAFFTRPAHLSGPAPAVLYNHAHGGAYDIGKDEFVAGRQALQDPPYARELASRGYCGLCIDTWLFGERRGRTESEVFKQMLWEGRVLWGMMVYDNLRALDWLGARPEVDEARIGTLGISMGSTMAWWTAALDERVKVTVDLCCLTDFHALIESRGLDGHGIYYYVPSLLKHFTTARINALIAPRAHLSLAGNYDRLTPPAGLDRVDAELRRVYGERGAAERWVLKRYETGHFETAEMRAEVVGFLERFL